jgi:hypothetical protein
VTCPKCQQAAEFHGYRQISPVSLLGQVSFKRAYYYCGRCGLGCCPFDEEVGLSKRHLTPGAEQVVCLMGLTDPFEEAADLVLRKATGLRLSESTIQRATEDAGTRLATLLEQGHTLEEEEPFAWHKDAHGRTCAYASVDLTGVPQQAADGGEAPHRMAYVACVYNPVPERPKPDTPQAAAAPAGLPTVGYEPVPERAAPKAALPGRAVPPAPPRRKDEMQARYLAGLYDLDELGKEMRLLGAAVGMEKADLWIALSDAGSGLENFLQTNFNRANLKLILDFYHPSTYLEKLAKALHPGDEEERTAKALEWCHKLKHEGGQVMLELLKGLKVPKAARAAYDDALRYFTNHAHRMDYPYYLSQGWHIGSGTVESACGHVVGQRCKQAGMRWRPYGTNGVCHLRALLKSGSSSWDAFWARKLNKRSISYQQK